MVSSQVRTKDRTIWHKTWNLNTQKDFFKKTEKRGSDVQVYQVLPI